MIIGLFTGFSAHGGIEKVNCHAGAVLTKFSNEKDLECKIVSLNDDRGYDYYLLDNQEYRYRSFRRNKIKFILYSMILARKAEIVYIGHINFAPIGFMMKLVNPLLRYYVLAYGVEVWKPTSLHQKLSLKFAQGIIAISKFTSKCLVDVQNVNKKKVFIVHPTLDPAFMKNESLESDSSLPDNSKIILSVGRLLSNEPGKGIDTVICALPKVLKYVPNIHYVVIGSGDYIDSLKELALKKKISDIVHFKGDVSLKELKSYYKQSEIFVMPSRQEGFGNVFLEAMYFEKPVIGCNFGGIPDIIIDGENGFLIDYGDVDKLTEYIVMLLQNDRLRLSIGSSGKKYVNKNYNFDVYYKKLSGILKDDISTH